MLNIPIEVSINSPDCTALTVAIGDGLYSYLTSTVGDVNFSPDDTSLDVTIGEGLYSYLNNTVGDKNITIEITPELKLRFALSSLNKIVLTQSGEVDLLTIISALSELCLSNSGKLMAAVKLQSENKTVLSCTLESERPDELIGLLQTILSSSGDISVVTTRMLVHLPGVLDDYAFMTLKDMAITIN